MKKLRIHLIQFPTVAGRPLMTLARVSQRLSGFTPKAGDWLLFPEMWPSGFSLADAPRLQEETEACFSWLQAYARRFKAYLAGSMLELSGRRGFNRAYVIGPSGRLKASYRKIHLFEHGGEHRYFSPGKAPSLFTSPWGKIGLAICYDLRFPELFRRLSQEGAKIFLVPSAWPRERIDHFLSLLKARAIENQAYVVGVNKVGPGFHRAPLIYGGHSAAFDPWGGSLAQMDARPGRRTVELDMAHLEEIRRRYPFLRSRVLG
ncbi:MAG TPA: nitrilase-related carbon-nitrogen hydrolase [bacterium]|nr:nitrilase-related carbon-nitrogen hydrolase [bacterium]